MRTQEQKAKSFIERARELGSEPTIYDVWIKWEPALPSEMIIEAVALGDILLNLLAGDISKE